MTKRIEGPYRVKNIGVSGDVFRVVYMEDEAKNNYREIDGAHSYLNRTHAYRRCRQLNKQWQEEEPLRWS